MSASGVIARRLRRKFTPQEYLLLERQASCKSEFYDGELFAIAGASREHNLIALSIAGDLRAQVRGTGCEVYASDIRVATALGSFFYPDVVVVCGKPHFADRQKDTLTNPVLIVEVLSKSTQQFDRLVKLAEYQHIPSVREIFFVPQDAFAWSTIRASRADRGPSTRI